MPLHDVGYRPWQGRRSGSLAAILVIAMTGIKLAWTSRWLRRAVFFAVSPAVVRAGGFFAFYQAVDAGRTGATRGMDAVGRPRSGGVNVAGVAPARRACARPGASSTWPSSTRA